MTKMARMIGSPQPWHSVLLSLGQGEPSSRLQMRHLPDQTKRYLDFDRLIGISISLALTLLFFQVAAYTLGGLFSDGLSSSFPCKYPYTLHLVMLL